MGRDWSVRREDILRGFADADPRFRVRVGLRRHLAWHEDVLTESEYASVAAAGGLLAGLLALAVSRRPLAALLVAVIGGAVASEAALHFQERAYRKGLRQQSEGLGSALTAAARSAGRV